MKGEAQILNTHEPLRKPIWFTFDAERRAICRPSKITHAYYHSELLFCTVYITCQA